MAHLTLLNKNWCYLKKVAETWSRKREKIQNTPTPMQYKKSKFSRTDLFAY